MTKAEPSMERKRAIAEASVRVRDLPIRPDPVVATDAGALSISAPHSDAKGCTLEMMAALASSSDAFVNKSLMGLGDLAGETDGFGHALAIIAAVKPTDELESVLAQQMVASHMATMKMTALSLRANTAEGLSAYGNMANKFARTFAVQVDALNKLRNGGAQVVRHVNVYPGGQAVVADQFHHHAPRDQNAGSVEQPHATGAGQSGERAALPCPDPLGAPMPVARGRRKASVPDARRQR